MSLGKSDPPAAPNYTAAAQQTAQGNLDYARYATQANRVNQITPYGNLTFTQGTGAPVFDQNAYNQAMATWQSGGSGSAPGAARMDEQGNPITGVFGGGSAGPMPTQQQFTTPGGGNPDQWTATTTLSPAEQQLLQSQQQVQQGLADTAQTGLGYVQKALAQPFNWSNLPAAPVNPGTTAQQAIMARLQPQINQQNDAFTTQMSNQGIAPGSEAWMKAHLGVEQQQNDLTSQAALQGIGLDTAARQQAIQEQEFGRTEPLNMLTALQSGAQVQNPQFVNVPQQQTTQGPNLLGAAQQQYQGNLNSYNAQQAQNANAMNGLFSLGGSALMGGFSPFSLGAGYTAGSVPGFGLKLPQF